MQCRYDVALLFVCLLLPMQLHAQVTPSPTPTSSTKTAVKNVEKPLGYVNAYVGSITVVAKGKTLNTIAPGTSLYKGDAISTAAKSSAELFLFDSGIIHLQENSKLLVTELPEPKSGKLQRFIRLLEGSLRGVFEKLDEPVNLESPTAIAGIRGTRVILDSREVAVLEGAVEVFDRRDLKRSTSLNSGERMANEFKKQEIALAELSAIDRRYDFPIVDRQTPYVMTQQQWAAQVAKQLDYNLPKGMAAYPAAAYLDLFSPPDESGRTADNFKNVRQSQNLAIDQSKQGDTVVVASKGDLTLAYEISIPLDGSYEFAASTAGAPQYWSFEGLPTLVSAGNLATAANRIGPVKLQKGIYQLAVSIPAGGKLGSFKLQGPSFKGYAPPAGWQKDQVLRYHEMLATLVKILAIEKEFANLEALASDQKLYDRLTAELAKRGFIFRGPSAAVRGEDANVNAALLRKKTDENVEDLRKRTIKRPVEERDPNRAHISPVLPGDIVEQ